MTTLRLLAAAALLCLALWALTAHAAVPATLLDRATLQRTAAAITRERYPDADDVLVDDHTRIIYAADGTSLTLADTCVKVLTDKGARNNRTLRVPFNVHYGTASVELVELIKPDGQIIPVDVAAHSRIMIDDSQMSQNIYDPNNKVLYVGIPGLEPGDLCRYVVRRVTTKARMPDTFSDYAIFEYISPIVHSTYEIWGPTSRPLVRIEHKAPVSNTVVATLTSAHGTNFYRWEIRDVPRMFPEPNMPALHTVVQRVLVSTIPDWETVSRWYDALCAPRLAATTPAMSNFVAEFTAGLTNSRARLEALFYYVSQNIRYMGITTETEAPGYEPHDVCITFENKYGVCRDKAALLVALLRLAGFKAYPVLIYIGPKKDPEVPQPYFNHAIVAVEDVEGAYTLMDPTDETTKELLPAYLCDKSYLVAKPEGDRLRVSPIIPAEANMMKITTTGELNREGTLQAETRLMFDGINDNAYRAALARMKPVARRQLFEGLVKRVAPGARLLECTIVPRELRDVQTPLSVQLRYETRDFPIRGAQVTMLPPLWFGTSIGVINFVLGATGLDVRKYPLQTGYACGVEEDVTIRFGDALGAVRTLPHVEGITSSTVVWRVDATVRDRALHARAVQQLCVVEFSPEEYRALKDALRTIEYDRRKRAIFATDAEAAAGDVVIHAAETEIDVLDAHTQRVLTRVKKEVLTYAGKKRHAELKVRYNPVWDAVTLQYARVTTRDGRVFQASTNEINLMDAAWVGGAPRYPAEKILVVNLPGVEIGSTIEYALERVHTHRPFVDTFTIFQGHDPIVAQRVQLRVPRTLPCHRRLFHDRALDETIITNSTTLTYFWSVTNQPAIPPENDQPPLWTFVPGVAVSCGSWGPYAKAVNAALTAAAAGQTAAAARAHQLTTGMTCRRARMRALRNFVAQHIRAAGPPFTRLPLTAITPADVTLRDGYGNSADRAVLLASMLQAVGITADFVLASAEPRVARLRNPRLQCPQRHIFPAVLLAVSCGHERIYLNDTDQYAELGTTAHDGRPGLLLPQGTLMHIRAPRRCRTRTEVVHELVIDAHGDARLTHRRCFHGMAFAGFHKQYAEMTPEQRRRHYLELVASIAQAARAVSDLTTHYQRYPGIEEFTVHIPRYLVRDGRNLYGTLPASALTVPGVRADTRTTPTFWDSESELTVTVRILAPAAFSLAQLVPPSYTWYAPHSSGYIRCNTVWEPGVTNHLTVRQELHLRPALIPPAAYPVLLEAQRRVTHAAMRTVLFSCPAPLDK